MAINSATKDIPQGASLDERRKAVDAAYPFGPRKYHPYKMWLIERRAHLEKFGYISKGKPKTSYLSPLERMMIKSKGGS